MKIAIPESAQRVQILIRRSHAWPDESPDQRTLAPEGLKLCRDIRPLWQEVAVRLWQRFGEPAYLAGAPAMLQTCVELFEPKKVRLEPKLIIHNSLKRLPDGWFQSRQAAGRTRLQIMREAHKDIRNKDAAESPILAAIWQDASRVCNFLDSQTASAPHWVVVTDEPAITLALLNWVPDEALALAPGEGTILYRAACGQPIGAQKVAI